MIPPYSSEFAVPFRSWCEKVSSMLEIEELEFCIGVEAEDLWDMSEGRREFAALAASRSLKVKNGFKFSLIILLLGFPIRPGTSKEQYLEELNREHAPKIRELMLPDTLRKTVTEAEEYLASRRSEQPPAPEKEESEG
jgi:hypothetical protein